MTQWRRCSWTNPSATASSAAVTELICVSTPMPSPKAACVHVEGGPSGCRGGGCSDLCAGVDAERALTEQVKEAVLGEQRASEEPDQRTEGEQGQRREGNDALPDARGRGR